MDEPSNYVTRSSLWKLRSDLWSDLLVTAVLAATVLIAYWPVRNFDFVGYDDYQYVFANPHISAGVTRSNIIWAFTTFDTSNYAPLTWLSLLIDSSVLGTGPHPLHVENAILHLINAVLVYFLFVKATGDFWPSAATAVLFAVHPTHVESVAWISERKDVLFMLFFLLAAHSYIRLTRSNDRSRIAWYFGSLGLFVCGLLSKSMLLTFSCVLILMDFWPLHRISGASTDQAQALSGESFGHVSVPMERACLFSDRQSGLAD